MFGSRTRSAQLRGDLSKNSRCGLAASAGQGQRRGSAIVEPASSETCIRSRCSPLAGEMRGDDDGREENPHGTLRTPRTPSAFAAAEKRECLASIVGQLCWSEGKPKKAREVVGQHGRTSVASRARTEWYQPVDHGLRPVTPRRLRTRPSLQRSSYTDESGLFRFFKYIARSAVGMLAIGMFYL